RLFSLTLRAIRGCPPAEERMLRCLIEVLDCFHFDTTAKASEAEEADADMEGEGEGEDAAEEDSEEEDAEAEAERKKEEEREREREAKQAEEEEEYMGYEIEMANLGGTDKNILKTLNPIQADLYTEILPVLTGFLYPSKKEQSAMAKALSEKSSSRYHYSKMARIQAQHIRLNVAVCIGQTIRQLPPSAAHGLLGNTIIKLAAKLKSKTQEQRDAARIAIVQVTGRFPPEYLGTVVAALRRVLTTKTQRHALVYTVHACAEAVCHGWFSQSLEPTRAPLPEVAETETETAEEDSEVEADGEGETEAVVATEVVRHKTADVSFHSADQMYKDIQTGRRKSEIVGGSLDPVADVLVLLGLDSLFGDRKEQKEVTKMAQASKEVGTQRGYDLLRLCAAGHTFSPMTEIPKGLFDPANAASLGLSQLGAMFPILFPSILQPVLSLLQVANTRELGIVNRCLAEITLGLAKNTTIQPLQLLVLVRFLLSLYLGDGAERERQREAQEAEDKEKARRKLFGTDEEYMVLQADPSLRMREMLHQKQRDEIIQANLELGKATLWCDRWQGKAHAEGVRLEKQSAEDRLVSLHRSGPLVQFAIATCSSHIKDNRQLDLSVDGGLADHIIDIASVAGKYGMSHDSAPVKGASLTLLRLILGLPLPPELYARNAARKGPKLTKKEKREKQRLKAEKEREAREKGFTLTMEEPLVPLTMGDVAQNTLTSGMV
ncbi:hypothetical protein KIPB_010293, partial [Kipferlia bialata]